MSVISRRRCDSCSKEINQNYDPPSDWVLLTIGGGFMPLPSAYDFCSHDCLKKWFRSGDRPWNQ
jgi:hypothetical protein